MQVKIAGKIRRMSVVQRSSQVIDEDDLSSSEEDDGGGDETDDGESISISQEVGSINKLTMEIAQMKDQVAELIETKSYMQKKRTSVGAARHSKFTVSIISATHRSYGSHTFVMTGALIRQ